MVFTRKDGDFHGRTVSLPEGTPKKGMGLFKFAWKMEVYIVLMELFLFESQGDVQCELIVYLHICI